MMKYHRQPPAISGFHWALAAFCLPILLWPLALFLSPYFSDNPTLSETQVTLFSVFFWAYPLLLAVTARILYKLAQKRQSAAHWGLGASAVIFYGILLGICAVGFAV